VVLALDGGYTDEWATFKRWQAEGEIIIRKGEKGSLIVYYDTMEKEDDEGETQKSLPEILMGVQSHTADRL